MTDKEITAKSQQQKLDATMKIKINDANNQSKSDLQKGTIEQEIIAKSQQQKADATVKIKINNVNNHSKSDLKKSTRKHNENEHITYLKKWLSSLPQSQPTKIFGDFYFDSDAIMVAAMKART